MRALPTGGGGSWGRRRAELAEPLLDELLTLLFIAASLSGSHAKDVATGRATPEDASRWALPARWLKADRRDDDVETTLAASLVGEGARR